MKPVIYLVQAVLAAVLSLCAAQASAAIISQGTVTVTNSDPLMTGRIVADSLVSTWAAPKPYPGTGSPGIQRHYHSVIFDSGTSPYLQISYGNPITSATNARVALYGMNFDPLDLTIGFLADSGLNTGIPQVAGTFQYLGTLNTSYNVLFFSASDDGVLPRVSYCVQGFRSPTDAVTCAKDAAVPAPAALWLVLLGAPALFRARRREAAPA